LAKIKLDFKKNQQLKTTKKLKNKINALTVAVTAIQQIQHFGFIFCDL
jgi:hypothetical protein